MKFPQLFSRILTLALVVAIPGAAFAQDAPAAQSTTEPVQQQPQAQSTSPQRAPQQPSSTGPGVVDPSAAPLTPAQPTPESQQQQLPSAPSSTTQTSAPKPSSPSTQEPLGTAAAESIRAVGGGASRPAGTAIAPAKQKQSRSLLIKFGAVAAIGVAAGVVYALSRGTSSVPPNTR